MRQNSAVATSRSPNVEPYDSPSLAISVGHALRTVRTHLDMDVGFVSEFVGDRRFLRHVDTKTAGAPLKIGDCLLNADSYCKKIVDGDLPQLIRDTAKIPEAMAIAATHDIPIGSHLSVPLRLGDQLYGTFCCFSFTPKPDLRERDLYILAAFADLVARQIDAELSGVRERAGLFDRIQAVLTSDQPMMVYQPCYRLSDHTLLGAESLSRFNATPMQAPDLWFADADRVNLKTDLELKAIRHAIDGYAPAWSAGPHYLAVNSSARTIMNSGLADVLRDSPAHHIILEITEHDLVDNYDDLIRALSPLRASGVRIAVDDAGSGYASMRHILNIRPDIIKLDVSLTNGIDTDRSQLALAKALCEFGRQTDCSLIAEGIETVAQLETLRGIGVHAGQGYFLGRPMPFGDFSELIRPRDLACRAVRAR